MHGTTEMGKRLKGDYSPMESIIFATLLKRGAATSGALIRKVYRRGQEPYNARIVVNQAVTTLGDKLKRNRESYRLERKRLPGQRLIENTLVRR